MWWSTSNQDKDNFSKFCKAFSKNLKLKFPLSNPLISGNHSTQRVLAARTQKRVLSWRRARRKRR
jgi:hypothetical protein